MDEAKEMLLADALEEAIRAGQESIELKRINRKLVILSILLSASCIILSLGYLL